VCDERDSEKDESGGLFSGWEFNFYGDGSKTQAYSRNEMGVKTVFKDDRIEELERELALA
jgi:hypothetical protein